MDGFPKDILNVIFSYLQWETLFITKFVCKRWGALVPKQRPISSCGRYMESLELLKWARSMGIPWSLSTYVTCAKNNNLEMLKWAHSNGYPREFSFDSCVHAVGHENILMLDYIWKCGFKFTSNLMRHAARMDKFSVMIYLREKNCPWSEEVLYFAAIKGNFTIFKWAHENGCPYTELHTSPNKDILDYAKANNIPFLLSDTNVSINYL